jgi:hypothetical protein
LFCNIKHNITVFRLKPLKKLAEAHDAVAKLHKRVAKSDDAIGLGSYDKMSQLLPAGNELWRKN